MVESGKRIIALFDVDMTLTPARQRMLPNMVECLRKVKDKGIKLGIVSGSDLSKIKEQVGDNFAASADFTFGENGLYAMKEGKFLASKSIREELGEDTLKRFINFCLKYMGELDIPKKRGTFIEYRTGMINVSPIGRNCSQEERDEFFEYDKTAKVRETFVETLRKEFHDANLTFSIGGQISFDVFPTGWDKSYCLQYVEKDFDEIHFFGDKTDKGGNDHEIYADPRTIGHAVTGPDDTIK